MLSAGDIVAVDHETAELVREREIPFRRDRGAPSLSPPAHALAVRRNGADELGSASAANALALEGDRACRPARVAVLPREVRVAARPDGLARHEGEPCQDDRADDAAHTHAPRVARRLLGAG